MNVAIWPTTLQSAPARLVRLRQVSGLNLCTDAGDKGGERVPACLHTLTGTPPSITWTHSTQAYPLSPSVKNCDSAFSLTPSRSLPLFAERLLCFLPLPC